MVYTHYIYIQQLTKSRVYKNAKFGIISGTDMNSHFPLAKKIHDSDNVLDILFSGLHTFQRLFCNNNYLTRKLKSVI